jgi:hypothetical protein
MNFHLTYYSVSVKHSMLAIWMEHETGYLPTFRAEVKSEVLIPPLPITPV